MSIQPLNNVPHGYPPPEATQAARPVVEEGAAKRAAPSTAVADSGKADAANSPSPSSKESLHQATQKVNQLIDGLSSDLKFTVDDETGSNVVKVIDTRTKEVIRQIPAQEMLEIAKRLDELRGLLIKEQV